MMRLLVPVDFSPCSTAAIDRAIALAEQVGGSIELLHAWNPPYEFGGFIGNLTVEDDGGEPRTLVELLRQESEKQLEAVAARTLPRFAKLEATLADGDPRETIASHADPSRCDLVVMGTHGRTGLSRLLLGSVAEWVIRHARVPVMTVRMEP